MKRTAVGYVRVSTIGQAEDGCSLALQRDKIQAYASLNDLVLADIIEDAGLSGKTIRNRAGIQQVLQMVESRKVDSVIIYKLDRMARNLREACQIAEMLNQHNCELHSITEKIDTTTASGRLFYHLISAMATWEAETIAERTSQALQGKVARGERVGSIPFGFKVNADGVHLEPDGAEQKIVDRIKWCDAREYSATKIAKILNREVIPTKHNGKWHARQVLDILRRTA